MKIFMVAFCADKKATFSPTKRQLTKRLLVAFSSVAFEPVYPNKLHDIETVSRRSRHRSNHTQKNIPSVVAGHQFLQFFALAQTTEYFLSLVIHPGFCLKTDHKIHFLRTAFSGPAACSLFSNSFAANHLPRQG